MYKLLLLAILGIFLIMFIVCIGCSTTTPIPSPAPTSTPGPATPGATTPKATTPAATTPAATAEKPFTFKYISSSPPQFYERAWLAMAQAITKESKGRIQFDMYPNQSLLPESTAVNGLASGIADCGAIADISYNPGRFPMGGLSQLPFSWAPGYDNTKIRTALINYPPVLAEYEKCGLKFLQTTVVGEYALASTRPIRSFADMKGLRARSYATIWPKMLQLCGAEPISLPIQESYTALQTGVINASPGTCDHIYDFKFHEVARNIVVFPSGSPTYGMLNFVWGLDGWNKLPKDIQDTVNRVLASKSWGTDGWSSLHEEGKAKLAAKGVPIYYMTPSEKAKFVEKANEVGEWWVEDNKNNGPSRDIYDYFIKLLKQEGLR